MQIGALIGIIGMVSMPVFAISQKFVPLWAFPLVCYGLALMMMAAFFMHWRRRRSSRNGGVSVSLKEAEAFGVKQSVLVAAIALIPAAALWGFFTFLGTLPG
jgi:hypothetical protein